MRSGYTDSANNESSPLDTPKVQRVHEGIIRREERVVDRRGELSTNSDKVAVYN